jgi:hypothetical protein
VLAQPLAGLGEVDAALGAVNGAVASAGQGENGQLWYVSELLRIKGDALLRQTSNQAVQAAADCFARASEMAREQGALFWKLWVALSLARLLRAEGRSAWQFSSRFTTASPRGSRPPTSRRQRSFWTISDRRNLIPGTLRPVVVFLRCGSASVLPLEGRRGEACGIDDGAAHRRFR